MAQAIPTSNVQSSVSDTLTGIDANHVDIASPHYDLSIASMFLDADIVVQLVIVMLLASSIWCWTIIFDKLRKFMRITRKMNQFDEEIWSGNPLEEHYEEIKDSPDHPVSRVFVAGMYEWLRLKRIYLRETAQKSLPLQPNMNRRSDYVRRAEIKNKILHAMDCVRNREIIYLERNLAFLATVGSAAPFIGLFGTVWGIMNSFQAIASQNNTSLSVVAPGIAEALFATAVGLFAAIPAVIFYNKFVTSIAGYTDKIDEFSDEFSSVIARELENEV